MTYERTEEIKQKQKNTMNSKDYTQYDWNSIVSKRKQTCKENGIKVGRKKGQGPVKKGWFKKCKCCDNEFWVIPSRAEKSFYCSRKCMNSDIDYKNKLKNIDRSYMKSEEYSKCKGNPDPTTYNYYKKKVYKLTEETYVTYYDEINPNKFPRTLAGVNGGYHLDHIISVKEGFIKGLTPEELSNKNNLQMLSWKENIMKGSK